MIWAIIVIIKIKKCIENNVLFTVEYSSHWSLWCWHVIINTEQIKNVIQTKKKVRDERSRINHSYKIQFTDCVCVTLTIVPQSETDLLVYKIQGWGELEPLRNMTHWFDKGAAVH